MVARPIPNPNPTCNPNPNQVVAHGLAFNGKTSFLRDPWNVLDFFIVLISLLVLLASGIPALR